MLQMRKLGHREAKTLARVTQLVRGKAGLGRRQSDSAIQVSNLSRSLPFIAFTPGTSHVLRRWEQMGVKSGPFEPSLVPACTPAVSVCNPGATGTPRTRRMEDREGQAGLQTYRGGPRAALGVIGMLFSTPGFHRGDGNRVRGPPGFHQSSCTRSCLTRWAPE